MIAFKVTVNDQLACTAGVGDDGVLNAIISWSGHRAKSDVPAARVDLHVGGLDDRGHLRWVDGFHKLAVGDRVMVDVVESEAVDTPSVDAPETLKGDGPSADDPGRCAFCGKPEREVAVLVRGPVVSICGRCINTCVDMTREHEQRART